MSTSPQSTPRIKTHTSAESLNRASLDESSRTTLERLLDFLLAAKRSLSATSQVWRANEIVSSARDALTESVLVRARSAFLREGIAEQVKLLYAIKGGVDRVAHRGRTEFETILRHLDDVDARLQATLDLLRSTVVEASLRPAGEEDKTLHDFVDEGGVADLKAAIKGSIDERQEAYYEFERSLQIFQDNISKVEKHIASKSGTLAALHGPDTPIPSNLRSLESHAKEMAELLESLVRHFDLCVTALKHTEGGGVAVQRVTDDLPISIHDRQGEQSTPLDPISDDDKREMFEVLEKDAAELEDVVVEIRDRLTEMEVQSEELFSHLGQLTEIETDTNVAFQLLEDVGSQLQRYVLHGQEYQRKWEEEKEKILDWVEELENLRVFYENFLKAYDGMIVEIGRRRDVQLRMEAVIHEAMTQIGRLYEEELVEREAFRQDQGDFLPSDIWPGLTNQPIRYEITPVNKESGSVPDIPRKAIEQAARRANRKL